MAQVKSSEAKLAAEKERNASLQAEVEDLQARLNVVVDITRQSSHNAAESLSDSGADEDFSDSARSSFNDENAAVGGVSRPPRRRGSVLHVASSVNEDLSATGSADAMAPPKQSKLSKLKHAVPGSSIFRSKAKTAGEFTDIAAANVPEPTPVARRTRGAVARKGE